MVWVWLKIKHTIKRVNRPGRQKLWVHWCLMLEPSPIVDPCRGGEKDEVPGVWQTDDWGTCSLLASGHYQQHVSGRTQQYGHENPDFTPWFSHQNSCLFWMLIPCSFTPVLFSCLLYKSKSMRCWSSPFIYDNRKWPILHFEFVSNVGARIFYNTVIVIIHQVMVCLKFIYTVYTCWFRHF